MAEELPPPAYSTADSKPSSSSVLPPASPAGPSTAPAPVPASAVGFQPPADVAHLYTSPPNAEKGWYRTPDQITRIDQMIMTQPQASNGVIASYDPALNDPKILRDFIYRQGMKRPQLYLDCIGTTNGRQDFNIRIDIGDLIPYVSHNDIAVVLPWQATQRGSPEQTFAKTFNSPLTSASSAPSSSTPSSSASPSSPQVSADRKVTPEDHFLPGRALTPAELDRTSQVSDKFLQKGIPWWCAYDALHPHTPRSTDGTDEGTSTGSPTLLDWCEAYTNDPSPDKSFKIEAYVWGWDFDQLRTSIINYTRTVRYSGYVAVSIKLKGTDDYLVAPAAPVLEPPKVKKRFSIEVSKFNSKPKPKPQPHEYNVVRIYHALKRYVPLSNTFPSETIESATARMPQIHADNNTIPVDVPLERGPLGVYRLLGKKEGQWLKEWEGTLKTAIQGKVTATYNTPVGEALDGWQGSIRGGSG